MKHCRLSEFPTRQPFFHIRHVQLSSLLAPNLFFFFWVVRGPVCFSPSDFDVTLLLLLGREFVLGSFEHPRGRFCVLVKGVEIYLRRLLLATHRARILFAAGADLPDNSRLLGHYYFLIGPILNPLLSESYGFAPLPLEPLPDSFVTLCLQSSLLPPGNCRCLGLFSCLPGLGGPLLGELLALLPLGPSLFLALCPSRLYSLPLFLLPLPSGRLLGLGLLLQLLPPDLRRVSHLPLFLGCPGSILLDLLSPRLHSSSPPLCCTAGRCLPLWAAGALPARTPSSPLCRGDHD